jgi:hypothetical protein
MSWNVDFMITFVMETKYTRGDGAPIGAEV